MANYTKRIAISWLSIESALPHVDTKFSDINFSYYPYGMKDTEFPLQVSIAVPYITSKIEEKISRFIQENLDLIYKSPLFNKYLGIKLAEKIREIYKNRIRYRFEKSVTPDGLKWAPLTESVEEYKRRMGFQKKILIKTGRLFESVVDMNIKSDYSFSAGATKITVEAKLPVYAMFHQFGVTGKIPQRKFLGFGTDMQKDIDNTTRYFVRFYPTFIQHSMLEYINSVMMAPENILNDSFTSHLELDTDLVRKAMQNVSKGG